MTVYTATFLNHNYGSFLQAYALQCAIRKNGAAPVVIQKKIPKDGKHRLIRWIHSYIPKKHYSFRQTVKLNLQKKRYKEKINKLDQFQKKYLSVQCFENTSEIIRSMNQDDILLAGSDQIWSMVNGPLSAWYTFQWPGLTKSVQRYSYAASIGLGELSEQQKAVYQQALKDFSVVSFREQQALHMLSSCLSVETRCDLDPTLLFDGEFWNTITAPRLVSEPYIFIYMLRPDHSLIQLGQELGKKMNCKVIYTGLLADRFVGVETICNAGIEEFLSYIKHAEAVITNSFHGTVFSILFEKRFASKRLDSTSSRVENLLQMTGLTERFFEGSEDVFQMLSRNIDYTLPRQRLEAEREKSLAYLRSICSTSNS